VTKFELTVGGVGRVTSTSFDFGANPHHDTDAGILNGILAMHCGKGQSASLVQICGLRLSFCDKSIRCHIGLTATSLR